MIKDTYQIKKTSWHAWLMKFNLGFTPNDFSYLCPYFWLTVMNVIIFPIMCIVKPIVLIILWVIKFNEDCEKKWKEKYLLKIKNNPYEINQLVTIKLRGYKAEKYEKFINWLMWHHYELFSEIRAIRVKTVSERHGRNMVAMDIRAKKKTSNKMKINTIVNIFKPIFFFFLIIIGLFFIASACYGGYKIVQSIKTNQNGIKLTNFFLIFIAMIALVLLFKQLAAYIKIPAKYRSNLISILRIVAIPFTMIFMCLAFCWSKFISAIVFVYNIIKDKCPAIEWTE